MFISSFSGDLRFLSNMFPRDILYQDKVFTCSETLYMAFKSTGPELVHAIVNERWTGYQAKKFFALNKELTRKDWKGMTGVQMSAMWTALNAKFNTQDMLLARLQGVPSCMLVERNNWNDRYWGIDKSGRGENYLGRMLQAIQCLSVNMPLKEDLLFVQDLNPHLQFP